MQRPAPRLADDETPPAGHGWPAPAPPPRPAVHYPPPRRSRPVLDSAWPVLAVLGLLLAGGAAIWYLSLNRTSPPAELPVPSVVGLREHAAVAKLTADGFGVRAIEEPGRARKGIVFGQAPVAHTTLARGAMLTIHVANGQKP